MPVTPVYLLVLLAKVIEKITACGETAWAIRDAVYDVLAHPKVTRKVGVDKQIAAALPKGKGDDFGCHIRSKDMEVLNMLNMYSRNFLCG